MTVKVFFFGGGGVMLIVEGGGSVGAEHVLGGRDGRLRGRGRGVGEKMEGMCLTGKTERLN